MSPGPKEDSGKRQGPVEKREEDRGLEVDGGRRESQERVGTGTKSSVRWTESPVRVPMSTSVDKGRWKGG